MLDTLCCSSFSLSHTTSWDFPSQCHLRPKSPLQVLLFFKAKTPVPCILAAFCSLTCQLSMCWQTVLPMYRIYVLIDLLKETFSLYLWRNYAFISLCRVAKKIVRNACMYSCVGIVCLCANGIIKVLLWSVDQFFVRQNIHLQPLCFFHDDYSSLFFIKSASDFILRKSCAN